MNESIRSVVQETMRTRTLQEVLDQEQDLLQAKLKLAQAHLDAANILFREVGQRAEVVNMQAQEMGGEAQASVSSFKRTADKAAADTHGIMYAVGQMLAFLTVFFGSFAAAGAMKKPAKPFKY